ncbi:c-type cytochrome [Pyxidicoccus xibeiensis]|uniref:c-type cytochrome n=1 Tax=Pyxidicoccus xibeiensis TaxID=2906759 RepID=UPI0020A7FBD0|nr:cytochrome c [Pyxidicoccus xibeiensis]MCP3145146.1 cytochrome c [Pyxidicoccus xibeiensis]
MRWLIPAAGLAALTGCDVPSEFLQRMEAQSKYEYYEASDFWADGRAMRTPPAGTVPRERFDKMPELKDPAQRMNALTGRANGQLVTTIPVAVDEKLLTLGQKKYNIVCSQCHGVLGDGNSIVAENMSLRLPPSLLELQGKPDGHFYTAINEGYGVMPSFSGELDLRERWAVVAYVRALQTARNTRTDGQAPVPQENR